VAKVAGRALERGKQLGLPIGAEIFAARLQVWAKDGRLEDVGDLRQWRHSEVRLKQ
jgi:hypothetical protein